MYEDVWNSIQIKRKEKLKASVHGVRKLASL